MTAAIVGEWARLLLGSLAATGVRDVVVSPGSRSTPFAWAAAHTPRLVCHSILDERSAAFFALGLARVTGEPALLLCTSGSAAANYFPAIVEASLAGVPLLVMTADRPLEIQDAGAPQTIDQVKLYGDFARRFFDLGAPDAAPTALSALPRIAAQAALAAKSPLPGPVHLNARARKPLEPGPAHTEHELAVVAEVERLLARGVPRVFPERPVPDPRGIEALAERLARAERGLIVCGPLALERAADAERITLLARKLDMPIDAEATSQLRFGAALEPNLAVDAFDWLFRAPLLGRGLLPDFVLRFGGTPVSASVELLLASHGPTALAIVAEHGFPDPTSAASVLVRGGVGATAERLLERLSGHTPRPEQTAYRERLLRANRAAWESVDAVVAEAGFEAFGEAFAVRHAVESVPKGGLLIVGNSLPVREVDAFVRAGARGVGVLCQRGASGIDGLISGAAGSAHAARRPTLLLLGDVSFAHDLGGLAAARRVETPLVVVVIDNDGGRIFEQLPAGRLFSGAGREKLAELWLTPPRLALEHAAKTFELPYACPASPGELDQALGAAFERNGASVVHVRVSPHGTLTYPPLIAQRIAERVLAESEAQ